MSECKHVMVKFLFKSSFGESDVVLRSSRSSIVFCSDSDLCVVDRAGR